MERKGGEVGITKVPSDAVLARKAGACTAEGAEKSAATERRRPGGRGAGSRPHLLGESLQQVLQVFPMNQDYVIVLDGFLEFGTGDDVVIALAPSCSVVRVIDRDGL